MKSQKIAQSFCSISGRSWGPMSSFQNLPSSQRHVPSDPQREEGAVGTTAGHHSTTHNYWWIILQPLTFSIVVLCMDFASWIYINLNQCLHGLSQSPTRQPHNSIEIIFKISVYAIIVPQGRHVANLGHVHGVCMLSYCTSNQQLVKMSFKNWVPICNVETCLQTGLKHQWDL